MKVSKRILIVLGICFVLVIVVMIFRGMRQNIPENALTVGVILPQTGILAEMGQYERQAMELAAEDLQALGHTVRLVFEDGKGDNKTVAAAAHKLLDINKVDLLITSTTGASLTAQPIVERQNSLLVAFCMSSEVAARSLNTVRFYIGIEEESQALLGHLSQPPRDTKVGILHANVALWATNIADTYRPFIKEHFRDEAVVEQYELNTKDFRPQLAKLKAKGVRFLIILGYGFEYERLFTQMVELRMRDMLDICGGWGFLYTGVPGSILEGIHVAGPTYVFERGKHGADFEKRFLKKYGYRPNFDAAFAYEVIRRLPDLWQLYNPNAPHELKAALAKHGEFQGIMGRYRFTPEGNMIVDTAVGVFHDGVLAGE